MKPHQYQLDGMDFLSARNRAILGDDAGLGKSMQMILAANRLGHKRLLVLCPAIGRVSWQKEAQTWDNTKRPVVFFPDCGAIPLGPVMVVVTLDYLSREGSVQKLRRALKEPIDAAFIDEVHYLKTPSARRTKSVYGARGDFKNSALEGVNTVWAASATLTPKHAGELYTHLRALLPDVLRSLFAGEIPSKARFEDRFCEIRHTNFGPKIEGNNRDTIPQLRAAFRPTFLARRKVDVLKDMPPIQCVPLPFEIADKALKAAAIDHFFDRIPVTDVEFMDLLASAFADPSVSAKRRALGLVKVPPAVEWVKDFLEQTGRKMVIFAHHRDVIEKLADELGHYDRAVIHGGTPSTGKSNAVEIFQTKRDCRLFIGQTHAAGTSITLTAASDVLLLEPDWSPSNNYQAICRCDRIGQNSGVIARFAYAAGTLDARISDLLRRRAADQVQLFGSAQQGYTA